MTIVDRYFDLLIERFAEVRATQAQAIDHAARACAASIAADKLVFSFGTGHGALPALEMFPRTGTIVGFRPIVESTMISFHRVWGDMGARQYRFIHAVEGYGRAILRSHHLDPKDSIVLFSHSGVNAVILDVALSAKEKGLTVIAVTSLPHSSYRDERECCLTAFSGSRGESRFGFRTTSPLCCDCSAKERSNRSLRRDSPCKRSGGLMNCSAREV